MDRRIPIWLAGARCNGSESSLAACGAALNEGTDACGLQDNLALVCSNDPATGACELSCLPWPALMPGLDRHPEMLHQYP